MKVYVVLYGDCEGEVLEAVYRTKESAIRAATSMALEEGYERRVEGTKYWQDDIIAFSADFEEDHYAGFYGFVRVREETLLE